MKIRKMERDDIPIVAFLHKENLESPSSKIGEYYLRKLYETLLSDGNSICLLAIDGNHIVGAIGATINMRKTNKLLKKLISLPIVFFVSKSIILGKVSLKELINRFKFENIVLERNPGPYPSILTLFVTKDHQRMGLGTVLTRNIIEIFRKRKIDKVYLDTLKTNRSAVKFYESLGFKRVDDIGDSIVLKLDLSSPADR